MINDYSSLASRLHVSVTVIKDKLSRVSDCAAEIDRSKDTQPAKQRALKLIAQARKLLDSLEDQVKKAP